MRRMQHTKIEQIIELATKHDLTELEVEENNLKVKVVRGVNHTTTQSSVVVAPSDVKVKEVAPTPEVTKNQLEVRSPFVGTFYTSSSPGSEPFVEVGKQVTKGQTLCIVEAMKLMNEIDAEKAGTIAKVLVQNQQPVEYDQVLFLIDLN